METYKIIILIILFLIVFVAIFLIDDGYDAPGD